MRHIKLYENWKRNSDDATIKEVADTIDDILLEISDMGFPYVQGAMISREKIMFEITATSDGSTSNEFMVKVTNDIISILERCNEYVDQVGYNMNIHLGLTSGGLRPEYSGHKPFGGKEFNSVSELREYINNRGYNPVVSFIGVTITKNKSNEIS